MPCNLVDTDRRFRRVYRLHHHGQYLPDYMVYVPEDSHNLILIFFSGRSGKFWRRRGRQLNRELDDGSHQQATWVASYRGKRSSSPIWQCPLHNIKKERKYFPYSPSTLLPEEISILLCPYIVESHITHNFYK